jgi:hypothetical protein
MPFRSQEVGWGEGVAALRREIAIKARWLVRPGFRADELIMSRDDVGLLASESTSVFEPDTTLMSSFPLVSIVTNASCGHPP